MRKRGSAHSSVVRGACSERQLWILMRGNFSTTLLHPTFNFVPHPLPQTMRSSQKTLISCSCVGSCRQLAAASGMVFLSCLSAYANHVVSTFPFFKPLCAQPDPHAAPCIICDPMRGCVLPCAPICSPMHSRQSMHTYWRYPPRMMPSAWCLNESHARGAQSCHQPAT